MPRDGQSVLGSFIEAMLNSAIGYSVAILSQYLIFPLYGVHLPVTSHLTMGLWFTIISIFRSLFLRRLFNFFTVKGNNVRTSQNMEASIKA